MSETLLVASVARERYGRAMLDMLVAVVAAVAFLAAVHYGARGW